MEKKFVVPELVIILFNNEDIITSSGPGNPFGYGGDEYKDED